MSEAEKDEQEDRTMDNFIGRRVAEGLEGLELAIGQPITLRDQFAMAALTGILQCDPLQKLILNQQTPRYAEEFAVNSAAFAFAVADAMLAKREAGEPE